MPNWTSNTLTLKGDKATLQAFLDAHVNAKGDLDFETVLSPPEGFNKTIPAGSNDDAAEIWALDPKAWLNYAHWPWVKEAGGIDPVSVRDILAKRYNDDMAARKDQPPRWPGDDIASQPQTYEELAAAYRKNIELTGHKNWYDWNCANWGTKWNAGDTDITGSPAEGKLVLTFDTAWCEPKPVFEALHKKFPKLDFDVVCRHEGNNEITGIRWEADWEDDE